jgi:hypothetical protein
MERKGEREEETHEAVQNASNAKPDDIVRGCLKRGSEDGEEHTQSHALCTADLVRDDAACESANDKGRTCSVPLGATSRSFHLPSES